MAEYSSTQKEQKLRKFSHQEESPPEASKPISSQDSRIASGPPSIDGSFITTPDPSKPIAEPEIGGDKRTSQKNLVTQDTFRGDISLVTGSNIPWGNDQQIQEP